MRFVVLAAVIALLSGCKTSLQRTGDNLAQQSKNIASMVDPAFSNCPRDTGLAYGACIGRAYDAAITQTAYPRPPGSSLEMRLAVIREQFDLGNYTEAQTHLALSNAILNYMAAGGGTALDQAAAEDRATQTALGAIAGQMQRQENLNAYRQRTEAWKPHSNTSCQGQGQTLHCQSR